MRYSYHIKTDRAPDWQSQRGARRCTTDGLAQRAEYACGNLINTTHTGHLLDLGRLGIPGVKYLDASSRGVGEGTRNYVVFDDRLISIVRKYGIAGASAMLGYNILDNISEAQAEELRRIEKGTELRK